MGEKRKLQKPAPRPRPLTGQGSGSQERPGAPQAGLSSGARGQAGTLWVQGSSKWAQGSGAGPSEGRGRKEEDPGGARPGSQENSSLTGTGWDRRLCPSSDGWHYHPKGTGLILRQTWDPRRGQQGKQDKERASTRQRGPHGAEQRLGFLLEGWLGQRDRCCCSTGWSGRGPTLGSHGNCCPFWRGAHLAQPNFRAASGPCGSRDGRHSLLMELSPETLKPIRAGDGDLPRDTGRLTGLEASAAFPVKQGQRQNPPPRTVTRPP